MDTLKKYSEYLFDGMVNKILRIIFEDKKTLFKQLRSNKTTACLRDFYVRFI